MQYPSSLLEKTYIKINFYPPFAPVTAMVPIKTLAITKTKQFCPLTKLSARADECN